MTSLLALALATAIGGTLLSLLGAPVEHNTATEPSPDPDDAEATPTVLAPAAVGGTAPPPGPDLLPSAPVPSVPVFPPPTTSGPPPTTSGPPDLAGGDPVKPAPAPLTHTLPHPRPVIRRPPRASWERHPFAAAGKLILFVAALGASGAVVVAAGVALLARSLR